MTLVDAKSQFLIRMKIFKTTILALIETNENLYQKNEFRYICLRKLYQKVINKCRFPNDSS